jgi:hypothetical protein
MRVTELINSYAKKERKVKNSLTNKSSGKIQAYLISNPVETISVDILLDYDIKDDKLDNLIKHTESCKVTSFVPMTWGFVLTIDSSAVIKYMWS